MYITDSMLTKACAGQRRKFNELFPVGVELTEALCATHSTDFDFMWAAENLLPEHLSAEYERQEAPLWAEYERQKAPLWAEYERQKDPLWAEYKRQCAIIFCRVASIP